MTSKVSKKNVLAKQIKRPATSSETTSSGPGNNQTYQNELQQSQGGATLPPVNNRFVGHVLVLISIGSSIYYVITGGGRGVTSLMTTDDKGGRGGSWP